METTTFRDYKGDTIERYELREQHTNWSNVYSTYVEWRVRIDGELKRYRLLRHAKRALDLYRKRPVTSERHNRPQPTDEYRTLRRCSDSYGETNDCSVIAVSVTTGVDYETAHQALERNGRKDRKGCWPMDCINAIRDLGFHVERVDVNAKTVRTLERELTTGNYLINVYRHFAGMRDGKVHDHSRGSLRRIIAVYRVTQ